MTTHYDDLALAQLRFAAATFADVQHLRIVTSNRVSAADRDVALLDPTLAEAITVGLQAAEHAARRALTVTYRQVVSPAVRQWQRSTRGVGEHLAALLLAEIGDPFVAVPLDIDGQPTADPYERTLSDLWAYAGLVPGRKKAKGMSQVEARALGNPAAKRHLRLLAEAQLKSAGPLRPLYDAERAKATGKVEATGKRQGQPWSDAHAHAHALRVVAKRLLRDLWRVRRDEYRAAMVEAAA